MCEYKSLSRVFAKADGIHRHTRKGREPVTLNVPLAYHIHYLQSSGCSSEVDFAAYVRLRSAYRRPYTPCPV